MKSTSPLFNRADKGWGLFTGLVAFSLYAWTCAPNVTLLDSGEFTVAAQHFGVPHPTGYPLWTLLAWLFHLLPIGNAAWKVNLFSSVCGGLVVGLATALIRSSLRWMLAEAAKAYPALLSIVSVTCGLLFAFSFSMWSQATIAEVYTLHALMIGLFLTCLYRWVHDPSGLFWLLASFFLLALAFSNHHLTLAMAPLPFLAVLLIRRELFWDLLVASILTALLAYLGFGILSDDPVVRKTSIRFFYTVMLGFACFVAARRMRIEWRLIAYLPFVIAIGLLPYAYMPLASSTNPPMNWSYTRTPEGFYYAFNRSQYSGTLAYQSIRSLGRLMGTSAAEEREAGDSGGKKTSLLKTAQEWVGFFFLQLGRSFTPFGVAAYFLSLLLIFRLGDLRQRTWIYLLEFGFVLAAILQPMADGAEIDVAGWWLQMPYHTYTNLFFAILAAIGLAGACIWLFRRAPRLAGLQFLLLALPVMPLILNYDGSSQRNRWFGWQFGHDMLKDLPQGSVVFGGTDPGRFVPTYMIFGESGQPTGVKRDPNFDRRDLFIITQNGVGEPLYRHYIADHYGKNRPAPSNAFELWLGRDKHYPKDTLVFPTEEEIRTGLAKEYENDQSLFSDPTYPHSYVTRLIWEKNRDKHRFFVEESFPLKWSYDHAIPHGLIYEISKEPLKELPADAVKQDMAFWRDYTEQLLRNPDYLKDYDAQRSFSKLRSTTGNLYRHRKMNKEAEIAYRQALALWTGNPEAINALAGMWNDRGDYDDLIATVKAAVSEDLNNMALWRMLVQAEKTKEAAGELAKARTTLSKQPSDPEALKKFAELSLALGETNNIAPTLLKGVDALTKDEAFLANSMEYGRQFTNSTLRLKSANALALLRPDDLRYALAQAAAAMEDGNKTIFIEAVRRATSIDQPTVEGFLEHNDPPAKWKDDPEVKALLEEILPEKAPATNATNTPKPTPAQSKSE